MTAANTLPVALRLRALFAWLENSFDAGVWWPADSAFEIFVGAILTQNTAWTNVKKAIGNLRGAHLLSASALLEAEAERLAQLIYPTGYRNTKAQYLREISQWYLTHHAGVTELSDEDVRSSLLSVRGVGDETADDILLYVYDRPIFIYDLYCRRLLSATGFGDFATYRQAKTALDPAVTSAAFTVEELQRCHGLIVEWGKRFRNDAALLPPASSL